MKSQVNKAKHGIDFDEAKILWRDPMLLEVPARTEDEERFLIVGVIGDRHWSAIVTYRSGKVRLISVRRARSEERELYEGQGL